MYIRELILGKDDNKEKKCQAMKEAMQIKREARARI